MISFFSIANIIDLCKRREDELMQDPFVPQRHGSLFRRVVARLNDDDEFLDMVNLHMKDTNGFRW
jgi:hypothetical protein